MLNSAKGYPTCWHSTSSNSWKHSGKFVISLVWSHIGQLEYLKAVCGESVVNEVVGKHQLDDYIDKVTHLG